MNIPSSPSPPNAVEPRGSFLTDGATPQNRTYKVDRSKVDPDTLKAAQGMETMFLDYMMKVMRSTVPKSEMDLESPATEVYRSMLDSENAQAAARAGGVGLTDQIIAYLQAQQYNQREAHAPTGAGSQGITPSTGGTRESQSSRQSERTEFRNSSDAKN